MNLIKDNWHGLLRKEFHVDCAGCGRGGYGGMDVSKKRAESELRGDGWRKVKGLWVCLDCIRNPPKHPVNVPEPLLDVLQDLRTGKVLKDEP